MSANIFLNRDFQHPEDGSYMIEPLGLHPNEAANILQNIDVKAAASIVKRFNAEAAAGKLSHGNEMLVDHEHFKHDADKETRAYGWLYQLESRSDGVYGKIRWTATGRAAVDGGDYRFFSTEYDPADVEILNSAKTRKEVRPLRLSGLTLTNSPNNRGGRPITNRTATREETLAALQLSDRQWAGGEFSREVHRFENVYRLTHDDARKTALWLNRDMARLAGITDDESSLQNASAAEICNRFLSLVVCYRHAHPGISFSKAWRIVGMEEPKFFKVMSAAE